MISFLIVAIFVFLIKSINNMRRDKEAPSGTDGQRMRFLGVGDSDQGYSMPIYASGFL